MVFCSSRFRCYVGAANCVISSTSPAPAPGRLQKIADATVWPRLLGNCHTHRHTEETIVGAGFQVQRARREWALPAWVPVPVSEFAIGRAVKPAPSVC